jgi:hypothetical protein
MCLHGTTYKWTERWVCGLDDDDDDVVVHVRGMRLHL